MESIIIYGAGNTGKGAYFFLRNRYNVLFFVDGDSCKWGDSFEKVEIKSPSVLKAYKKVKIVIASIFWKEIIKEIDTINLTGIYVYNPNIDFLLIDNIKEELNIRTINLGSFLKQYQKIECQELTFMSGGSQVLDYAFLKALVIKYNLKNYLEIGTYIGESINILTDYCDKLYSITAPLNANYSMAIFCKERNLPNYSERLTANKKIKHYFTDSKLFDFTQIEDEIDLYFIDGDHSYDGVYYDTKNIFKMKKDNAIVVWHDFRGIGLQYKGEIVAAVKDALGNEFKNVYVTDNNLCGIYLPDRYIKDFEMRELKYEDNAELYTYDVVLKNCHVQ